MHNIELIIEHRKNLRLWTRKSFRPSNISAAASSDTDSRADAERDIDYRQCSFGTAYLHGLERLPRARPLRHKRMRGHRILRDGAGAYLPHAEQLPQSGRMRFIRRRRGTKRFRARTIARGRAAAPCRFRRNATARRARIKAKASGCWRVSCSKKECENPTATFGASPYKCGPPQAWLTQILGSYDSCGNSGNKYCTFGFNNPAKDAQELCQQSEPHLCGSSGEANKCGADVHSVDANKCGADANKCGVDKKNSADE